MAHYIISDPRFRIAILGLSAVIGSAILLSKLYFEQIRHGEDHVRRISRQSVRRIRIPAKRGKILTSDLKVLADNTAGCMIVFYPAEMRRPGSRARTIDYISQAAAAVSSALQRENPLNRDKISIHLRNRPGLPLILFRGLTPAEAAPALMVARNFEGVGLEEDDTRAYPEGKLAAHLIGYTRKENPGMADDRKDFFYYVPDQAGRTGLEKAFDTFTGVTTDGMPPLGLRGIPGYSLALVDILGFIRNSELDRRDPIDGNHLILTLDSRAQKLAEQELQGKRGAFVLLDADTGAVLAMASSPSPDLSKFTPILTTEYYRSLLNNPEKPLLNRALHGVYTPGSIVKVLVAMALLENGVEPTHHVNCTGRAEIGTGGIRCAARSGHGELDLVTALERSCNVYFIEEGCQIGRAAIAEVFRSAGIGHSTGFELPDRSGLAPSVEYKKRHYRTSWNQFDTAQISIGQGILLLTPLQAAAYTGAIANGGKMMRPYIADRLVNQRGGTVWHHTPEESGRLAVSAQNLELVKQGMFQVVNAPNGSGKRAKNNTITLYGKTGSAEVGSLANRTKNTWFIAFGTHKGKTYAVAMLEEEGVSGGSSCAPYVANFFERYLKESPE